MLSVGEALCLAEGERRNAVYLAQLGHEVTAQGLSEVGLAKAHQLAFGTGGPPVEALLIEPETLRREVAGLELLVLQERHRWIEEGPYHWGKSAVVQVLGRKAT